MSQLKSLLLESQPTGSGVAAAPTEDNHFANKKWVLEQIPDGSANHAAVTKLDSNSTTIVLSGQQITVNVRLKSTDLQTNEAPVAVGSAGLFVALGLGANQPAPGIVVQAVLDALDGKAPTSHAHSIGNVTGLQAALDAKAATDHTHTIGNVSGLQAALDAKSATDHTHTIGNVSGLQAALDAKAATDHTHTIGNVSGLQAALDAKAASDHSHSNATNSVAGFMSAADKVRLDALVGNEQWRASVSTKSALPLNTDSIGSARLVLDTGTIYRCIATVGFVDDQWAALNLGVSKVSVTIGNGSLSTIDVVHNFNTRDVVVSLRQVASPWEMQDCRVQALDVNTVRLLFTVAPATNELRVTIIA